MAKLLKRASGLLVILWIPVEAAFASQGPGVANGTATTADQIWLGVGLIAALLAVVALDRRGRS